ncbi:MAG: hypothetical protein IMF01_05625 [Proteobacteria bacterium]|nr:hypothetical protein [Pseudomonadota bacterium]
MTEYSNKNEELASSAELASAKDVIQSIVKSSKAFKMYLPNNPLHQKFFNEFRDKLAGFLDEFGDLRLNIGQFTLSYEEEVIYENRDIKEGFAFKLYSDGIIGLNFREDIKEDELKVFLDILGENYNSLDDDIATRLWLSDLPNIDYILAQDDSSVNTGELGIREASSEKQEQGFKRATEEADSTETPPSTPVMAPQQMLSLTGEEHKWLEDAKKEEEEKNPIDEISHILYCIIAAEKDEALFVEFVKIAVQMIRGLIGTYKLENATGMIRSFQRLSMQEDFPAAYREPLLFELDKILTEETSKKIGKALSSRNLGHEKLNELLLLAGRNAAVPLCQMLGAAEKNSEAQEVIITFLSKYGDYGTQQLLPFLKDKKPHLVLGIIQVLLKKGDYSAIDQVGKLVSRMEEKIKREVLQYLKNAATPKSTKYLMKLAEDSNIALRMRALKVMAAPLYSAAVDHILAIMKTEEFEGRELAERMATFETIAGADRDKTLAFIKEQLSKKFWFNKTKELESIRCAAAGLSRMGTKQALETLEYAAKAKKGESRTVIEQALRSFKIR